MPKLVSFSPPHPQMATRSDLFSQNRGGYGGGGGPTSWSDAYDVVGGTMAVSSSFTETQWRELQRQSAIYKYMAASVPVPLELLAPFAKPTTQSIHGSNKGKGCGEVGFPANKDSEPWRCRRTDGKKWRCTRDVAPEQKYCERHTHKGRHARSRKPVELNADFVTGKSSGKPYRKPCSVSGGRRENAGELCSFPTSSLDVSYEQSRCLDWFMKGETDQQWLNQQTSYPGFGESQQTRGFIDAWSTAGQEEIGTHKSSGSSSGKLPFSCLTLSVCSGGDESVEEDGVSEVGPTAMGGSGSWMSSPPGGPLGEALCLGISSFGNGDGGQGVDFLK